MLGAKKYKVHQPVNAGVHGWLALDKPVGMSSAKAVAAARRIFQAKKAGHGGTLDPMACGVLPIAFGEATKTVSFVMEQLKAYRFTAHWGTETDTDDLEGSVTRRSFLMPVSEEIERILPQFVGDIDQVPPIYSAIRVNGRRSYELARSGKIVKHDARKVRIDSFRLKKALYDRAEFEVICTKGTYVRSLARDLGRALRSAAHVSALRRIFVGPFREGCSFSLDSLERLSHSGSLRDTLVPLEIALDDIPALFVSGEQARRIRSGQAVIPDSDIIEGTVRIMAQTGPVAIGCAIDGRVKPIRVFNF